MVHFLIKFLKQKALWSLVLRGMGLVFSYAFTIGVIRLYGEGVYGMFTICLSVTIFFILLGKMGLDLVFLKQAVLLQFEKNTLRSFQQRFFKELFVINVFFTLVYLILVYPLTHYYFKNEEMFEPLLLATVFISPSVFYITYSEGLRGIGHSFSYLAIQFTGLYLFDLFFIYVFSFFSLNPAQVVIGSHGLSCVVMAVIGYIFWEKALDGLEQKGNETTPLPDSELFSLLKQAKPFFLSNTAQLLTLNVGSLILAYFSDTATVGKYDLSFKLANLISLPLMATAGIVASKIGQHVLEANVKGLRPFLRKIHVFNSVFGLLFLVLLIVFGEWLLTTFFGEVFEEFYPIVVLLCAGFLINSFSGSTDLALQLTGHEVLFQRIMLSMGVLNIVLTIILTYFFSAYGTAISFVLTMIGINTISLYFIKKKLGLQMVL